MKVRMLRTKVCLIGDLMGRADAGQEYDLPAETAKQFILEGSAYDIEERDQVAQIKVGKVRKKNGRTKTRHGSIS